MPQYVAFVPVAESDEGEKLYARRDLGDFGRIESAVDAAFGNPYIERAELVKSKDLAVFGVTRAISRLDEDGEPAPKKTRRKRGEAKVEEAPADDVSDEQSEEVAAEAPAEEPPADTEDSPAEDDPGIRGFGSRE